MAASALSAVAAAVSEGARAHVAFLLRPGGGGGGGGGGNGGVGASLANASNLLVPWAVQLVASWLAFASYARIDAEHFAKGAEHFHAVKLPTRHPVDRSPLERAGAAGPGEGAAPAAAAAAAFPPLFCGLVRCRSAFAYSQLHMVPLVLYNQLVVWPLVSLLLVWPTWQAREAASGVGAWPAAAQGALLVALMLVSDHLWYWAHRMLHLPAFWSWAHREHHAAPQSAISATFVHPIEYALFCLAMQLPFALAGFPMRVYAVPLAWGMFTGSGAHSGYSGALANGDEHNAHHLVTDVNFGLLMVADRIYGTHWRPSPGAPVPPSVARSSALTRGIAEEFGGKIVGGVGREVEEALAPT
jgi:hypothetical protein